MKPQVKFSIDEKYAPLVKELVCCLVFLGMFSINYLRENTYIMHKLYIVYDFGLFALVCLYWVLNRRKFNTLIVSVIMFFCAFLLAEAVNGISLLETFLPYRLVSFVLLIDLFASRGMKEGISGLSDALCLLVLANTISVFVVPEGLYYGVDGVAKCWLLGEDNVSVRIYFLAVFCAAFEAIFIKRKATVKSILAVAAFFVFVWVRDIGAGKACSLVLILALIPLLGAFSKHKLCMWHVYIVTAVLFLVVVVFNELEVFQFLIEDILGRSMTLTHRTEIWAMAPELIGQSPIIGHGTFLAPEVTYLLRGDSSYGLSLHDTYLSVLYCGGIVLFVVFCFILLVAGKSFDSSVPGSTRSGVLVVIAFAFMVHALAEGNDCEQIVMMACLLYYAKFFIDSDEAGGLKEAEGPLNEGPLNEEEPSGNAGVASLNSGETVLEEQVDPDVRGVLKETEQNPSGDEALKEAGAAI